MRSTSWLSGRTPANSAFSSARPPRSHNGSPGRTAARSQIASRSAPSTAIGELRRVRRERAVAQHRDGVAGQRRAQLRRGRRPHLREHPGRHEHPARRGAFDPQQAGGHELRRRACRRRRGPGARPGTPTAPPAPARRPWPWPRSRSPATGRPVTSAPNTHCSRWPGRTSDPAVGAAATPISFQAATFAAHARCRLTAARQRSSPTSPATPSPPPSQVSQRDPPVSEPVFAPAVP